MKHAKPVSNFNKFVSKSISFIPLMILINNTWTKEGSIRRGAELLHVHECRQPPLDWRIQSPSLGLF